MSHGNPLVPKGHKEVAGGARDRLKTYFCGSVPLLGGALLVGWVLSFFERYSILR
jgi:hypothetical protein